MHRAERQEKEQDSKAKKRGSKAVCTVTADDLLHKVTEISRGWKCKTKIIRHLNENRRETFLAVQWLRIHLPMQGTQVPSLVGEPRSICCRTTKPMQHNYKAPWP